MSFWPYEPVLGPNEARKIQEEYLEAMKKYFKERDCVEAFLEDLEIIEGFRYALDYLEKNPGPSLEELHQRLHQIFCEEFMFLHRN